MLDDLDILHARIAAALALLVPMQKRDPRAGIGEAIKALKGA
jgi:hypothetical protein